MPGYMSHLISREFKTTFLKRNSSKQPNNGHGCRCPSLTSRIVLLYQRRRDLPAALTGVQPILTQPSNTDKLWIHILH